MTRLQIVRAVVVVVVALVLLAGPAVSVFAQETIISFPAGGACEFPLQIDIGSGGPSHQHQFVDKSGNVVGEISAGRGNPMTYTNLSTGKTMSTQANGAVSRTKLNPDGTTTLALIGHNVVILYPTDVPAGPSTTLYVGQVVFTVDGNGVWTLEKTSGKSLDICAALSN